MREKSEQVTKSNLEECRDLFVFGCLSLIDLDNIMPSYFFSDVGDMTPTNVSSLSEEEKGFKKIIVRKDFTNQLLKDIAMR